jgi:hypothetical protein
VKRERRNLIALGMAAALALGLSGTSSAFIGDDGYSYTQPGAELVMPFDATEGMATFLIVSNIGGVSSDAAQVSTHWTFWSDTCDELTDFSVCLTLNDTVVINPRDMNAIGPNNEELGPNINLDGNAGVVTVVAYETNAACGDFRQTGANLVDNAIVGSFTVADTAAGYSFGNDAFGLGTDDADDPTRVILPPPPPQEAVSFDLPIFNPETVDVSWVFLSHLRSFSSGPVEPANAALRFSTSFIDNLEVPTSLPDSSVGCAEFLSVQPDPIPGNILLNSSGLVRLVPLSGVNANNYLYGVVGQAVGAYGASTSLKVNYESSPSLAFIAPASGLLD